MLVQLDSNAAPCPDELGRSSAEGRPCLRVEPWPDPVIDELGHDPRSAYVETFWLPVLRSDNYHSRTVSRQTIRSRPRRVRTSVWIRPGESG